MTDRFNHIVDAFAGRPRVSALAAVALVVLFASQIRPPEFSGSMIEDISGIDGRIDIAREIKEARDGTEWVLAMVRTPDLSIGATFAAIDALQKALNKTGVDARVSSLDVLKRQLFVYGLNEADGVSSLIAAVSDDAEFASIVSRDHSLFSIIVAVPGESELEVVAFLRDYDFAADLEIVDVLAAASLDEDVADGLRADLLLLIPSIILVMLAILLFVFGHWRALVLPLFASVASAIIVFSLLSIADISINLVTLLAFPIVLIVALANSCHFSAKSVSTSASESDRANGARMAMQRVAMPYLISCLTTAVALASLGFNEIGPIRDLGFLASVSLLVSFFAVLMFAPWSLIGHLKHNRYSKQSRPDVFSRVSRVLGKRRAPISIALLLLSALSAASLSDIGVRSDARIFFPDNAAFTRAFHRYEAHFHVFSPFRVLVRYPDAEQSTDGGLDALRRAGVIRDALAEVSGVAYVAMSPAADQRGVLLTATLLSDAASDDAVALVESLGEDDAVRVLYSSAQVVYESIDRQAMASLSASLWLSLLVIFAAIGFLFRSLRALLAAIIANAVPLLLVFGVVWITGDPLNLVTAFVFLVALGVIVDDTIHLLYVDSRDEPLSGSSIEFSVLVSTLMLCAGLLLCQLSDFPTTRQFALYCALALSSAVLSDLTLLPALLRYRDSRRSERSAQ